MAITMHWTSLLTLLTLTLTTPTPTLSLTTARIWTKFYPHCPPSSPSRIADLDLGEEFGTGLNIHTETCQPVPVPLAYSPEVSHVSIDTDAYWTEPGDDRCTVALHELPGCVDPPLIARKIQRGNDDESECQERRFPAFNQVWVRFFCEGDHEEEQGGRRKHAPVMGKDGEALKNHGAKVNVTDAGNGFVNGTAGAGANKTEGVSRLWQRRRVRLSFL